MGVWAISRPISALWFGCFLLSKDKTMPSFCQSLPTCCSLVKVINATVCYTQWCGSFSKGSFPASGGNPMAQSKKLPTVRRHTLYTSGQLFMIQICFNILHKKVKVRSYTALYPVCKSAQSMNIIIHPLVDLFIPRPTRLLWQAVSHAAITAQRLFTHTFPPLSTSRYSFIAEWTGASWNQQKCPQSFLNGSKMDLNPGSLDCESCVLLLTYSAHTAYIHTCWYEQWLTSTLLIRPMAHHTQENTGLWYVPLGSLCLCGDYVEILESDNTPVCCLGCEVKEVDLIPYICEAILAWVWGIKQTPWRHETYHHPCLPIFFARVIIIYV